MLAVAVGVGYNVSKQLANAVMNGLELVWPPGTSALRQGLSSLMAGPQFQLSAQLSAQLMRPAYILSNIPPIN